MARFMRERGLLSITWEIQKEDRRTWEEAAKTCDSKSSKLY